MGLIIEDNIWDFIFELIMTHTVECTVTACRTYKVRKGGDFFYGKSTNNENHIEGV